MEDAIQDLYSPSCCSVTQSSLTLCDPWLQHTRLPCPSLSPRVCSDSHTSSRWCHPTISSSVIPFSSCPQSFPASVFSNESALPIRWTKYWPFSCFIARERKSMPGFKASKDRLTLLLGANVCGDLKLKPMFIYYLNILGPLIMMPNPLCLCSVNGTTNPRGQHIFWQHSLLNILSPLLRTPAKKKKNICFKIWLLVDNTPSRPRPQMELNNEIDECCFHACEHINLAAHGSRSYFDFQVLLLKKYIL